MMEREKQIEEMAQLIYLNYDCPLEFAEGMAEFLYDEGYRKLEGEWVSVEERMPEDVYGKDRKKITVLVCTKGGKVSTATRQRIFEFNSSKCEWKELDTFEWSKRKRVEYWMPLPGTPKMKGGEG